MMHKFARSLASLKITIFSLCCTIILILLGTFEQVFTGIFQAQELYFRSFFVHWHPEALSWPVPCFLGGYSLGIILFVNLLAAFIFRFKFTKKGMGLCLIHIGLLLLILGEIATGLFAEESQMMVHENQVTNYSENFHLLELALIDQSSEEYDEVSVIPYQQLYSGKTIEFPRLGWKVTIKALVKNAKLSLKEGVGQRFANRGIGPNIAVSPQAPFKKDEQTNVSVAYVEVHNEAGSLGTWLLSNAIEEEQTFEYQGKLCSLTLRPRRSYFPFSLELLDFVHLRHPGTDIPEEFSSQVQLYDANGESERQVLISMNRPLRYDGKVLYQASFGDQDTLSVLQVVDNPSLYLPYIASTCVAVGLLIQFISSFQQYKRRRNK